MSGLLAGTTYDPAGAVSKATDTLLAMTALDSTNLRLTFTAPTNGCVLVRIKTQTTGATTFPRIFLGAINAASTTATGVNALNSATVNVGSTTGFRDIGSFVLGGVTTTYTGRTSTTFTGCSNHAATTGGEAITGGVVMRMSPMGASMATQATMFMGQESLGLVTGLTAGASYTWDAAYGVDIVLASTNIKYGGPNDATGADAWGGIQYEIWDTNNLLAGLLYDPAIVASTSLTSLKAMTAFDTTNCRVTFTTNASGPGSTSVFWRVRTQYTGNATTGSHLLGILDGATVKARVAPTKGTPQTSNATSAEAVEGSGVITGLTASTSYTWDAAYAVQVVATSGGAFKAGGPDDATTNNAFGGMAFEIWTA